MINEMIESTKMISFEERQLHPSKPAHGPKDCIFPEYLGVEILVQFLRNITIP